VRDGDTIELDVEPREILLLLADDEIAARLAAVVAPPPRYSTGVGWPGTHCETTVDDNAQLALAYLMAYQSTGNRFFRNIAEQVIEYVLREMTDPSGGFYSTEDADSEGEEGKFYVWTDEELRATLGDLHDDAIAYFEPKRFEGACMSNCCDGTTVSRSAPRSRVRWMRTWMPKATPRSPWIFRRGEAAIRFASLLAAAMDASRREVPRYG
jgi:hypothetical protein